jgi:hypothetical protein
MKEALKLALEALEFKNILNMHGRYSIINPEKAAVAITAIKEALAQPEQEPVAKLKTSDVLLRCHRCGYSDKLTMQIEYTTPPQRTWVGLKDEEVFETFGNFSAMTGKSWLDLYRITEAKLKEKNT